MTYLLDTCMISKLRKIKRHPNPKLEAWAKSHSETHYFLSVLTIGEIQTGISKLNSKNAEDKRKIRMLEDWLFGSLIPRFQDRILDIDADVAFTWGKIIGESKQKGNSLPAVDALIAATAIRHQLIVVTENIKHFEDSGAKCFNPCEN